MSLEQQNMEIKFFLDLKSKEKLKFNMNLYF